MLRTRRQCARAARPRLAAAVPPRICGSIEEPGGHQRKLVRCSLATGTRKCLARRARPGPTTALADRSAGQKCRASCCTASGVIGPAISNEAPSRRPLTYWERRPSFPECGMCGGSWQQSADATASSRDLEIETELCREIFASVRASIEALTPGWISPGRVGQPSLGVCPAVHWHWTAAIPAR